MDERLAPIDTHFNDSGRILKLADNLFY
jgi:hypothetical protein